MLMLLFPNAMARNGCRQCNAMMTLETKQQIMQTQAEAMAKASIGSCATGGEYQIIGYSSRLSVCSINAEYALCYEWKIHLKIWRYCGNGSLLDFTKMDFCSSGVCALKVNLYMKCNRSVDCASKCNIAQCI